MTRYQWISHTCRAIALAELAAAAVLISNRQWYLAVLVAYTAPSLLFVDSCARRTHRQAGEEAQRAARLEAGEQVQPLTPCCSFWHHSDGQVHGPDCTRPPLPRRDTYRLDDAGRTAFAEITRRYNDRSAA
ncbi:hypothetical protein ACH419_39410 [Streptomyces bobili]|uniref:hypothetical protein n=1 Tax=Streptomyces bobili TaxID=67280 RepID=UPI0037A2E7B1